MYSAVGDETTKIEHIANGEAVTIFRTDECVDGKLWAYGLYKQSSGWVIEWDSASDTSFIEPIIMPDTVITASRSVISMAWLPDGGLILATSSGLESTTSDFTDSIDTKGSINVLTHPALPNILAAATGWGLIRIYDITTDEILYESVYGSGDDMGIEGNVTDVVGFDDDGSRLLIQTPDSVILLDTATWEEVWYYPISLDQSAYSPDGRWVAFAGYAQFGADLPNIGQIQLLEIETETIYNLSREDLATTVFSFGFSSDSQTLFAGDNKGNIQAWSVEDQTLTDITRTTLGDSDYRFINAITDLPQENLLLAAIRTASFSRVSDDEIAVYQDGAMVGLWTTEQPFQAAKTIAVSPDGTQLAILLDGVVWIENVDSFKANIQAD